MKKLLIALFVSLSFQAEANDVAKLQNAFYRATLPMHEDMVAVPVYHCKFVQISKQSINYITNITPGYKFVQNSEGSFGYRNKAMKYADVLTTADIFLKYDDVPYVEGFVDSPYIWRQLHYSSEFLKKLADKVLISEWNVSNIFLKDYNLTEKDVPHAVYMSNKPFAYSYSICAESLDAADLALEKILK